MSEIHTILHPTDFSPACNHATQIARALAHEYNARLVILHVLQEPVADDAGLHHRPPSAAARNEAQGELQRMAEPRADLRIDYHLEDGDPAEQVLRLAKQSQCDLIVMGTHGRTGLERLLMGSVAERVSRQASCPVLTVRMPRESEGGEDVKAAIREGLGTPHT